MNEVNANPRTWDVCPFSVVFALMMIWMALIGKRVATQGRPYN